ncbi:MAG: ABC transporter transmembrane domain-containing protein [Lachnospiraceae bacterium]
MGKNSFTYWFILIATLIIESFLQILYSYVTKRIINAIEFQNIELFRTAVIASVIIVILKCLFPYLRYFQIKLVRKMVYELKLKLYEKLLSMNMDFFKSTHSADAIKTLNWDANSLKDSWFSHISWVLGKIVMVASAIITMCFYSPILVGISLIICALQHLFLLKSINQLRNMRKWCKRNQRNYLYY